MTPAIALFLLLAPHGGHVFGGQPVTVTLRHAVDAPDPWGVRWALTHDGAVLHEGTAALEQAAAHVTLELPEVRVRTALRFTCRLTAAGLPSRSVEPRPLTLVVYPPTDFAPLQAWRDGGAALLVSDREESPLAALLTQRDVISSTRATHNVDTLGEVRLLIVDQDALSDRVLAVARRVAERGGGVLILAQTPGGDRPAGDAIVPRRTTPARWQLDHPLLAGMDAAMLDGWAGQSTLSLPWRISGRHVYGVGGWPHPELPDSPTLDAMLSVERRGEGVIVRSQLRVDDWRTDPRAQWLLNNALIYLASPPPSPVTGGTIP